MRSCFLLKGGCLVLGILLAAQVQVEAANLESPPSGRELVFLTWSDYMDPELIREFENLHQVRVKQVYFETDELRNDMLLAADGAGFDVILCNDTAIGVYVRRNWLEPLREEQIPNLRHIDRRWRDAVEGAKGYGAPYFWGTVGIAWRRDLIQEPVTSWKQLFRPAEKLRGRIVMIKDSRDTLGMALKALGYSANSTEAKAYAEVERLLMDQRPFVQAYSYVALTEESGLVTGDVWMAMINNGDALMLKEHHPEIAFTVPVEGGNLWIDYLAVLRSSSNKELARKFIDFMNEPSRAARLALYVHYPTPNRGAEKLLPPDFLSDPLIYPPRDVLERSEFYTPLPPRTVKKRNAIFSRMVQ